MSLVSLEYMNSGKKMKILIAGNWNFSYIRWYEMKYEMAYPRVV